MVFLQVMPQKRKLLGKFSDEEISALIDKYLYHPNTGCRGQDSVYGKMLGDLGIWNNLSNRYKLYNYIKDIGSGSKIDGESKKKNRSKEICLPDCQEIRFLKMKLKRQLQQGKLVPPRMTFCRIRVPIKILFNMEEQ